MPAQPDRDAVARLRAEMAAIDATHPPLRPRAPEPETVEAKTADLSYPDMPEGDDWMQRVPPKFRHGERGFDRRLMADLAAVGVRCYRLDGLHLKTAPPAVPVFLDWLEHLEDRVPGPETEHRFLLRIWLIHKLRDPAARGKQRVVDVLIAQIRHDPPLRSRIIDAASEALGLVARAKHFPQILEILRDDGLEDAKPFLIQYLGKVRTDEAKALAVGYLDTVYTWFALKALMQMKATGVRDVVAPYAEHSHLWIRQRARLAMKRLPD
jgi:hypothetical protein